MKSAKKKKMLLAGLSGFVQAFLKVVKKKGKKNASWGISPLKSEKDKRKKRNKTEIKMNLSRPAACL